MKPALVSFFTICALLLGICAIIATSNDELMHAVVLLLFSSIFGVVAGEIYVRGK